MLLNLQWLRVNDVATDDGHFGFDLPDLPSRDSHVVDADGITTKSASFPMRLPRPDQIRAQDVFRVHGVCSRHRGGP